MVELDANLNDERRWAATWLAAAPALERVRRDELRALNERPYFDVIENVLQLGGLYAQRRDTSGLVEQQRLFRKARP